MGHSFASSPPASLGLRALPSSRIGVGAASGPALTRREGEVLSLVAEGYSNKLIADRLLISERTVKSHLTNIMTKLWAQDRTHAVVTAVRLGRLVI